MIKPPYSISNFERFAQEGFYYVDRTKYIEILEQMPYSYVVFLRPRRFGKSLFVSILYQYYGLQFKDQFERDFGKLYIGQHPTPLANKYLVLFFDFSGIETATTETTYRDFLTKVKIGVRTFLGTYTAWFDGEDVKAVNPIGSPQEVILYLFEVVRMKAPGQKIYILMDEYDHFANELIAFRFHEFSNIVSKTGWVRKFYEAIKTNTGISGVVERMFITGVSPITLDSLTSGFNIATNLTTDPLLNEMMGFTEEDVRFIFQGVGMEDAALDRAMLDAKDWYDGYLFCEEAHVRVYNPDMVLYFAAHYYVHANYPKNLLDTNIASDYSKVRKMARIGDSQAQTYEVMDELIENGVVKAGELVRQYNFELAFRRDDFVSLLFYMGLLTVREASMSEVYFQIPNYVIRGLYLDYFRQLLEERHLYRMDDQSAREAVIALAKDNDITKLVKLTEDILHHLSNRDSMNFEEKHLKVILTSLFFLARIYTVHNEFEIGKNYVDLLCTKNPSYPQVKYQLIFELKYLKKKDARKAKAVTEEGKTQLEGYLKDAKLTRLPDLKAWLLVFSGEKSYSVQSLQ